MPVSHWAQRFFKELKKDRGNALYDIWRIDWRVSGDELFLQIYIVETSSLLTSLLSVYSLRKRSCIVSCIYDVSYRTTHCTLHMLHFSRLLPLGSVLWVLLRFTFHSHVCAFVTFRNKYMYLISCTLLLLLLVVYSMYATRIPDTPRLGRLVHQG